LKSFEISKTQSDPPFLCFWHVFTWSWVLLNMR